MDVKTFTDTRQNLKDVMDHVVEDHVPVVVTRRNAEVRSHGLPVGLELD